MRPPGQSNMLVAQCSTPYPWVDIMAEAYHVQHHQATVRGKAFDQHSWAVLRAAFAAPELLSGATAETFQESLPVEQEGQVWKHCGRLQACLGMLLGSAPYASACPARSLMTAY
jgi:hypothetical protein